MNYECNLFHIYLNFHDIIQSIHLYLSVLIIITKSKYGWSSSNTTHQQKFDLVNIILCIMNEHCSEIKNHLYLLTIFLSRLAQRYVHLLLLVWSVCSRTGSSTRERCHLRSPARDASRVNVAILFFTDASSEQSLNETDWLFRSHLAPRKRKRKLVDQRACPAIEIEILIAIGVFVAVFPRQVPPP